MPKPKKILVIATIVMMPLLSYNGSVQAAQTSLSAANAATNADEEQKCRDLLTPQQGVDCLEKLKQKKRND